MEPSFIPLRRSATPLSIDHKLDIPAEFVLAFQLKLSLELNPGVGPSVSTSALT
jgi:hypothetical protein